MANKFGIVEFLRSEQETRKISQAELAKLLGLSRGYLSQLMSGTRTAQRMGSKTIIAIAKATKRPIEEIVTIASRN